MERLDVDSYSVKSTKRGRSLEVLLREISAEHGFLLVDFSPYKDFKAYSLYDENSVEYQTRTSGNGKKTVVETYPLAARLLVGTRKNRNFYVNKGNIQVYCTDDYYKDSFGEYDRIQKLSDDFEDALGCKFALTHSDKETSEMDELYERKSKRILQFFRDPESL